MSANAAKPDLSAVLEALRATPAKSRGGGRAIMFVSARDDVTEISRAAAEAAKVGNVYAIDLDLKRNALGRSFASKGKLGAPIDGRLSGISLCAITDAHGRPTGADGFSYHRVGMSNVLVGAFDARSLPPGARMTLTADGDYWTALRASGATAIVNAPALETSQVALRVARHMDAIVLVVREMPGAAPVSIAAKDAIVAAGGNLIGLVYTDASPEAAVIDRITRKAS